MVDSLKAMRRFSESAGSIGELFDVITAVAGQTDLLAMNATAHPAAEGYECILGLEGARRLVAARAWICAVGHLRGGRLQSPAQGEKT
jgi:hypothetical protein